MKSKVAQLLGGRFCHERQDVSKTPRSNHEKNPPFRSEMDAKSCLRKHLQTSTKNAPGDSILLVTFFGMVKLRDLLERL